MNRQHTETNSRQCLCLDLGHAGKFSLHIYTILWFEWTRKLHFSRVSTQLLSLNVWPFNWFCCSNFAKQIEQRAWNLPVNIHVRVCSLDDNRKATNISRVYTGEAKIPLRKLAREKESGSCLWVYSCCSHTSSILFTSCQHFERKFIQPSFNNSQFFNE